jgi:hypothetical protein
LPIVLHGFSEFGQFEVILLLGGQVMSAKSTEVHLANATKLPQAIDDSFNLFDTNGTSGWYTLDVLNNDKGGNAKHIVSVDGLGVLGQDYTINDDGTISVHLDNIDPGTIAALNFSYTIQLGNGALSTAGVQLQVASTESLLENGSFENPDVLPAAASWAVTDIPGWTNTNGSGIEVWATGHRGIDATDGTYLIETDSYANVFDSIQTTIDAVTDVTYELTFDFASRPDGPGSTTDSFEVWWNGSLVGSFDPASTDFQSASIDVVGAAGTDTLEIREAGANDSYGALVDNVSLVITNGDWMA